MKIRYKILFFAILVIAPIFLSIALARYGSNVVGTGMINVATFFINGIYTENFSADISNLSAGTSNYLSFSVTNYNEDISSEVVQNYRIVIYTTENLPLEFTLLHNNETNYIEDYNFNYNVDSRRFESSWGIMPLVETSHNYTLKIDIADKDERYSKELDIVEIIIESYQKGGEE